jgi:hypothetical protein
VYGAYTVLRVADPHGPMPGAGQFYMLAAAEGWGGGEDERPFLPRAFSVLRATGARELHFLLEDVGPGTARLCELDMGDGMWVAGPFGNGFAPGAPGRRPVLCGGGAGIAPLGIWQDELGPDATVLLGFRDAAHAEGAAVVADARLATDDGSVGHHGLVTERRCSRPYARCAPGGTFPPSSRSSRGWRAASAPASAASCPRGPAMSGSAWTGPCSTPGRSSASSDGRPAPLGARKVGGRF